MGVQQTLELELSGILAGEVEFPSSPYWLPEPHAMPGHTLIKPLVHDSRNL